jgi:hypothetical protein
MRLDVFNGSPKNNLTRLEPDQGFSGWPGKMPYGIAIEKADALFRDPRSQPCTIIRPNSTQDQMKQVASTVLGDRQ